MSITGGQAVSRHGETNNIGGVPYSLSVVPSVLGTPMHYEYVLGGQLMYYHPIKTAEIPPAGMLIDINTMGVINTVSHTGNTLNIQFGYGALLDGSDLVNPANLAITNAARSNVDFHTHITMTIGSGGALLQARGKVELNGASTGSNVSFGSDYIDTSQDGYIMVFFNSMQTHADCTIDLYQSWTEIRSQHR